MKKDSNKNFLIASLRDPQKHVCLHFVREIIVFVQKKALTS